MRRVRTSESDLLIALKLVVVPAFLLLVSLAGKRWGPGTASRLAGLPVVTGPILFFLAYERGPEFAAAAAATSLSAVFASISFSIVYSNACIRWRWAVALPLALSAWAMAAFMLSRLDHSLLVSVVVALPVLAFAPLAFPAGTAAIGSHASVPSELLMRMAAGAVLTLLVTRAAADVGPGWSGLLAVFPVLGAVLAVFSHRTEGARFNVHLLRAMVYGMYSFAAFCVTLSLALAHLDIPLSFGAAILATLAVQGAIARR